MIQYQHLLKDILAFGVEKRSGRANIPNTFGISHATMKFNLQQGFPLLTTKKMYLKGVIHELLWFLRGETNIKPLVDNNVNIWNKDAYRWYETLSDIVEKESGMKRAFNTEESFVNAIKGTEPHFIYHVTNEGRQIHYTLGDLGRVYGYQWRNQNGVDQIKEVLKSLKENPDSRYHIIDGWNKADFKEMALPPCHLLYQFIARPKADLSNEYILDLNMYQRSCDTFLGVPFNISSMSLLLMIFAKASGMEPGTATWIGGDTHIYMDHKPMVELQLSRNPYPLPKMEITKELNSLEDILALKYEDFKLSDYQHHPEIKAELFTGLKK